MKKVLVEEKIVGLNVAAICKKFVIGKYVNPVLPKGLRSRKQTSSGPETA
jgi:hypothetical protein